MRMWTAVLLPALIALTLTQLGDPAIAQTKGISASVLARAKAGDASAQWVVGYHYERGQGVRQNYKEAAEWYRRAAIHGNALAQTNLGNLYRDGEGVPQDDVQAASWWRKAAEQGDEFAQFSLGSAYRKGRGVPQDFAEAAVWYRKAADQGAVGGQYLLALLILKGDGVAQDLKQAISWFEKAAQQGDASSEDELGQLYEDGGVGKFVNDPDGNSHYVSPTGDSAIPKDFEAAAKWYRQAALQGDSFGQNRLGQMYSDGKGVPQDFAEAYFWLSLASAHGSDAPTSSEEDRDRVASRLTKTILLETQERARKFAAHQPSTR